MDNVAVVELLDAAISFFGELGLEVRGAIEGDGAGRLTGLDGHGRLELSRFLAPVAANNRNAWV